MSGCSRPETTAVQNFLILVSFVESHKDLMTKQNRNQLLQKHLDHFNISFLDEFTFSLSHAHEICFGVHALC